jgi:hypothetical protein
MNGVRCDDIGGVKNLSSFEKLFSIDKSATSGRSVAWSRDSFRANSPFGRPGPTEKSNSRLTHHRDAISADLAQQRMLAVHEIGPPSFVILDDLEFVAGPSSDVFRELTNVLVKFAVSKVDDNDHEVNVGVTMGITTRDRTENPCGHEPVPFRKTNPDSIEQNLSQRSQFEHWSDC